MPPDHSDPSDREKDRQELFRRFSRGGLARSRLRRLLQGTVWPLLIGSASAAKRLLDFTAAALLLLLLAPMMLRTILLWQATGRHVFQRTPRLGRWCREFDQLSFAPRSNRLFRIMKSLGLISLPVLFNILKGDMSFIGPRPVSPGELSPRDRMARRRYDVKPGLIGLWWLRQRGNIAYDSEAQVDRQYVDSQSVWGDLGIVLRAIPAVFYGKGSTDAPDSLTILGMPIRNLTMSEAVQAMADFLNGTQPRQVCFVNADCANLAYRDPEYLSVLRTADLCLADGIGIKLAGKLLGREIRQNVNGTDLFPRLCEALAGSPHSLYLLGARPGIAEAVRDWISQNYPGARVAGCRHGYFPPEEEPAVLREIAASGASLLLVSFGAPRQDKWIRRHLPETGVKVAMGVGGLMDFYSGRIPRAPQWMRDIGFEWIFRFYQEPGRMWRRYLIGNAVFMYRVLVEKYSRRDRRSPKASNTER